MSGHTVTVEDASLLFAQAGVPRSPRSIRRYCERGHLDCVRIDTENAQEQYLITRESIEKRITELKQVHSLPSSVRPSPAMTGLDRPGPAPSGQAELIELLKDQLKRKDEQIAVKDDQIKSLNHTLDATIERDRETNVLLKLLSDKVFRIEASGQDRPDMTGHVVPYAEQDLSGDASHLSSEPPAAAGL